jgi:hypothetical protein
MALRVDISAAAIAAVAAVALYTILPRSRTRVRFNGWCWAASPAVAVEALHSEKSEALRDQNL